MIFDQNFVDGIDENPIESIVTACNRAASRIEEHNSQSWSADELTELMETAALVDQIIQSHGLFSENSLPESSRSFDETCSQFFQYIKNVGDEFQASAFDLRMSSLKDKYASVIRSSFAYEFTSGDLSRVQALINELRGQISETDGLEEKHKQRLLSRLERLQSELHKRVSDLDRFWGLVGDAGVALGKLGNDAKPIVDRIREISQIVWRTQSRAEELPSGASHPLLGNDSESEDE